MFDDHGDDTADPSNMWEQTVRRERAWVLRYLAGRVPPGAVEDVAQDVWISLLELGSRYQERGRLRGLLRVLADRRVSDWHRRAGGRAPAAHDEADGVDPDFSGHILKQCGIKPGSLLWLRVVEDWSVRDLASHFGVPAGTVKSRLHNDGMALRHRLGDWRQEALGLGAPCTHLRAAVLDVVACPRCSRERTAWDTIRIASHPYSLFQTTYFTLESNLGLWVDASVATAWRRWHEPVRGMARQEFGPIRRFQNARGENLLGRVRSDESRGTPYWTYDILPTDGPEWRISHRGDAAAAEQIGALRPSRRGAELVLDISYPEEGDGAMSLELPLDMVVERVDPAPRASGWVHGRQTVMWTDCASLGRTPVVVARWR